MIVYKSTILDASVEQVWQALKLRDTFLFVTRGVMSYRGTDSWPRILMCPGVEIRTAVCPFGLLPGSEHTFQIVRVDNDLHEINTNEHGQLIRTWKHTMKVAQHSEKSCRYSDRIEIDAGYWTGFLWAFSHFFYWYRQRRWRILASDLVNRKA